MKKYLALAVLLFPSLAHAWPSCSGNWNQVPSGTTGTTGTGGIGEIYSADGITWQCQAKVSPPPAPTATNTNTNQNSNSNSNSNNNSNSNSSKSSSTATSVSNSSSTASSNQSQTQTQGQKQVANGGNANASATGGAAENNSSGNETSIVTNIPRQTAMAYAPSIGATIPCFKTYGGGAQSGLFGLSLGGGVVDQGCDAREVARSYATMGSQLAACKVMVQTRQSKKAGVTLDDCMAHPTITVEQGPATPIAEPISTPTYTYSPQIQLTLPQPLVTVIPNPVVPPTPNIAAAAKANELAKKVHHTGKPCPNVTNDNIQSKITEEKKDVQ